MKVRKFFPLVPLVLVYILYGSTLAYPFVYDDLWRIVQNPGIQTLTRPFRFFFDPTTQAGIPQLHYDNYRPLSVLLTAVQYAVWGGSASDFRLMNLVLHALNTTLVVLLGIHVLSLSMGAAALAGLLFLVHPVQVESVVWISSQSNLLAGSFFLAGLLLWARYLKAKSPQDRVLTHAVFIIGLLVRETLLVFPLACWWMDRGKKKRMDYVVMGVAAMLMIVVRKMLLGQVAQSPLWGGSWATHAATVLKTWPLFLKKLIWPDALRVTYSDLDAAGSLLQWNVAWGCVLLAAIAVAAVRWRKSRPAGSYTLGLLLILWLPVSNLFPLRTLFAERFLYLMVAPAALLLAAGLDVVWKRDIAPWARVSFILTPLLVMALSFKTVFQTRVWIHEYNLWANAAEVAPGSWFSWANLSGILVQGAIDRPPHISVVYLRMAEDATRRALDARPPAEAGAELFLRMAIINKMQGDMPSARDYARRAYEIRPDLEKIWKPG